jgi:hypothetical protein
MTTLLQLLFSCSHPIEMHNQCASQHGVLQTCAKCGSYRWLGGAGGQPAWTRPTIVEEAVARAVAEAKDAEGTAS